MDRFVATTEADEPGLLGATARPGWAGLVLAALILSPGRHATAQEVVPAELAVRHYPAGPVYARPIGGGRSDALLQLVALVNRGEAPVEATELSVEVRSTGDDVLATYRVSRERLERGARAVGELAGSPAYDFFRRYYGLDSMLGAEGRPTPGRRVDPGRGLVLRHVFMVLEPGASLLRIEALALGPRGDTIRASEEVPLLVYENANTYSFPLRGTWYVSNASDPTGSHRWEPAEEFALDLSQRDARGASCSDPCRGHEDFYAFGAPVHAVAPGTVVAVQDHVGRTPFRRSGESREAFQARLQAHIDRLRTEDPGQLPGNFVILDHGSGEYSYYGHLDAGSVTVKEGERVERLQVIGRLGQSGYSTAPHLHFQLMDAPHQAFSRGLPIRFDDVTDPSGEPIGGTLRAGRFVTAIGAR